MEGQFVLGFISALLAATGGQVVSHLLTSQRERKNELRTKLEKMHFPILDDIISVVEFYTVPYHGHVKESFRREINAHYCNILSHIDKNRFYAGTDLLKAIMKSSRYKWSDDLSGVHQPVFELEVLLAFMIETIDTLKKLGMDISKELIRAELMIAVWILALKVLGIEPEQVRVYEYEINDAISPRLVRRFSTAVVKYPFRYQKDSSINNEYLISHRKIASYLPMIFKPDSNLFKRIENVLVV